MNKTKFEITIKGNDVFDTTCVVRCDDFRDACLKAQELEESYEEITIEGLWITSIREVQ